MGRSSHWFKSIIAVFLIAIVLFLAIYFFSPDLSLRFFGIAFGEESIASTALEDLLVDNFGMDRTQVQQFLKTEEGQQVVNEVKQRSKKGAQITEEELMLVKKELE